MFDLTAVTAIATVLLFFATWRAATAAKRSADIVAREFKLLRRPLVAVTWTAQSVETDGKVLLLFEVTEVAGIATTLHSVEASATLMSLTEVVREEPNATLSGDLAPFIVSLALEAPQRLLPLLRPGDSIVVAAELSVKVVISVDDDEADEETWQTTGLLEYDRSHQCYLTPKKTDLYMRRLGGRTRGPRSRILDPVCRAWERWWDSVQ